MDRFINPNGGMPFELDDLIFIQDSLKEGFKGLLHEFVRANYGSVILSGCKIEVLPNGDHSLSEGYVMLGYEVCHVPATVTSFAISALIIDIAYDPNGNEIFENGVTKDTYQVRKAAPWDSSIMSLPNIRVLVSDENRLTHLMPETMKGNWALTDFVGEKYIFQSTDFKNGASANTSSPPYAIKKNGVVRFYGVIDIPAGITPSTPVLDVPVSFRKGITDAGAYLCSYGFAIVRFGVHSHGLRYLDTAVTGTNNGHGVSLNQISYDIDNI